VATLSMNKRYPVMALLGIIVLTPLAANAEPLGWGYRGDIRHFNVGWWHGGHWHRTWHDGRFGWWWVVAGAWYFYPAPVYPYPDPYTPPIVIQAPPQTVVVQPQAPSSPAPSTAAPAAPPPTQYWYYCDAQKGYYPYVAACPGGWKEVPTTPPE